MLDLQTHRQADRHTCIFNYKIFFIKINSTFNTFEQTDHQPDDDIIPYVEEQIPITTSVAKILSLPEDMSNLVHSYLKNHFVRTTVQVRIIQIIQFYHNYFICNSQFTFSQ